MADLADVTPDQATPLYQIRWLDRLATTRQKRMGVLIDVVAVLGDTTNGARKCTGSTELRGSESGYTVRPHAPIAVGERRADTMHEGRHVSQSTELSHL